MIFYFHQICLRYPYGSYILWYALIAHLDRGVLYAAPTRGIEYVCYCHILKIQIDVEMAANQARCVYVKQISVTAALANPKIPDSVSSVPYDVS